MSAEHVLRSRSWRMVMIVGASIDDVGHATFLASTLPAFCFNASLRCIGYA